jgi:hypothetical protein
VASLLLCVLVALQDRPVIREIQTVTGGFARSGCWLPLKVRMGGPAGFEGEIVGSADSGFRVARPFRLNAGGAADVLLPVVLLAADAKVEIVLRGPGGDLDRKSLGTPLQFLQQQRLVLIDPRHPEFESWAKQEVTLPTGTPVRFAASDPADWNEAAEAGALEIVDGVVASDERAVDLTMVAWRALGGALVTQPRRDLLDRLAEPATRFPVIDATVSRMTASDPWILKKRDSTLLFIVIYGFGFFVMVYVTWSRRGGAWLLAISALGAAAMFVAAYAAFYPKGSLAFLSWQGIVDAPEAPVAISVTELRGAGRVGDVTFGRVLKPVYATAQDAARRPLELRLVEGRWIVRGAAPGDPTRFVGVERLAAIDPFKAWVDDEGEPRRYRPEESAYFLRVPRKFQIRLQNPATAAGIPAGADGVIDSERARVFRVELRK